MNANRAQLRKVPLSSIWPPLPGVCYCTMAVDQWDDTLSAAADAGFVLLEVVEDEVIVAAYRKQPEGS